MKKAILIILAAAMVLCLLPAGASAENGSTYYVDADCGDDGANGLSPETAWKTLSAHSDFAFAPGDNILLKAGGIYQGRFQPVSSGTASEPITVSSYGEGARPLLITSDLGPAVLLRDVSGWSISGLEFTSPHGAGIMIYATPGEDYGFDFLYGPGLIVPTAENPTAPEEIVTDDELTAFLKGVRAKLEDAVKMAAGVIGCRAPKTPPESRNIISDFSITDCVFHDIAFRDTNVHGMCTPIYICSYGSGSRVDNVYISGINIYNCAYGIKTVGTTTTQSADFISMPESYNNNIIVENTAIDTLNYDAIILGSVENGLVRNCSVLNTCLYDEGFTAPVWLRNCDRVTVECCEIAGSKNLYDGMTVDFDYHVQNSTYQYIYSHDNSSFMKSNNFDTYTANRNNTVRYCLSVNDNKTLNVASISNIKEEEYEMAIAMENFKFYNNTVINCAPTLFGVLKNSTIANNIFVGSDDVLSVSVPLGFCNTITNNCFYNMCPMPHSTNDSVCDPGFVGTDESDKNSFVLSQSSPLIGKGIQVEQDMGERDFYGNTLTGSHNIGCYEGPGAAADPVETERAGRSYVVTVFRFIQVVIPMLQKMLGL